MKKFILIVLVIFCSRLFTPILFVVSTGVVMKFVCELYECERKLPSADSTLPMFKVMVRLPAKGDRVEAVLLDELSRYIEKNPDSTLLLSQNDAETSDGSWEYSVTDIKTGFQTIDAHTLEGARIEVRYRASQHSVHPLRLKVVSTGILFVSLPIAGVFTWVFSLFARRARKKFEKRKKIVDATGG